MTFTTRTIDSDGVSLATRDYGGPAPALVLMHGAGMEQGSLEPLVQQLRGAFRVVTFDFRGHGGSDLAPWTFATAVQDLNAVAAAYGLGGPAVGGHSLGGMVAATYGREHPTCPGVINIDGHGRGRVDQYPGYAEVEVRESWDRHQRRLDRLTRGPVGAALRGLLVVLGKKPATTATVLRQVTREVEELDPFARYEQLTCPLLVFNATAEEDRRLLKLLAAKGVALTRAYRQGLRRDLAALAADNPLVQAVEVDARHMLIRTHPELVAKHISDFLQPRAVHG
ncbi:MAG: alpha/beta fold hydrolase [Gemmatimonadales bacterium]